MTPFVTIVIPTFNREATLPRTLASLRAQTDPDWECVLVDDGSSDKTLALAHKSAQEDGRFRVLERPADRPKGANACRNLGAESSQADFLIFLDSDDVLTPNCVATRKACQLRHPQVDLWVFTSEIRNEHSLAPQRFNRDPHPEETLPYLAMFLSDQVPWLIMSPLWRKSAFEQVGGFDASLQRHQDADLHVRALLAGLKVHRAHGPADNAWMIGEEHKRRDLDWRKRQLAATLIYLQRCGEALQGSPNQAYLKPHWKYFWYRIYKDLFCWYPDQLRSEKSQYDELMHRFQVFHPQDRQALRKVFFCIRFRARTGRRITRWERQVDEHFGRCLTGGATPGKAE